MNDSTFGGWDRYTGQKIHDAIQNARNSGNISDFLYLISFLGGKAILLLLLLYNIF